MNLLCRPLVPLLAVMLAGCAHSIYSFNAEDNQIYDRHRIIADVTCTHEEKVYYKRCYDDFPFMAVPRVRLTAGFQIDRVIKGDITNRCLRIVNAVKKRTKASSYQTFDMILHSNTSCRVGFDRIVDGETRSLDFLFPPSRPKH